MQQNGFRILLGKERDQEQVKGLHSSVMKALEGPLPPPPLHTLVFAQEELTPQQIIRETKLFLYVMDEERDEVAERRAA